MALSNLECICFHGGEFLSEVYSSSASQEIPHLYRSKRCFNGDANCFDFIRSVSKGHSSMEHWWKDAYRGKQKSSARPGPNVTGSTTNPIRTTLGSNRDLHGKSPVSNKPSHGMATYQMLSLITVFTAVCHSSLSTAILNHPTPLQADFKIPLNISISSTPGSSMLLRVLMTFLIDLPSLLCLAHLQLT